jgi:hypothetical protein
MARLLMYQVGAGTRVSYAPPDQHDHSMFASGKKAFALGDQPLASNWAAQRICELLQQIYNYEYKPLQEF